MSSPAEPSSHAPTPSSITPDEVHDFVEKLLGDDVHARRVHSLADGVVGVLHTATLGIHAIGLGLAEATGELVAPSVGPTRTEADFAAHVAGVVATAPDDAWAFVCDRLNTHQGEALVRLVAAREGLAEELGVKGVSGVLHTLATRAAYLSDPSHRIPFVYTPKHTSWLNQVEIWFSILARRLLKRASFVSADDLRARLLAFIDYFNRTLAKPFRWTYRGRPLRAGSRTDTSAVVY